MNRKALFANATERKASNSSQNILKILKRRFGTLEFISCIKFVRRWMKLNINQKKVRPMIGDS